MQTLDVRQGDEQWHALRAHYHTASEAPCMMGASPHLSREDLLRLKATGEDQEHSQYVQDVVFQRGHQVEEAARPLAEDEIGEELYPTVAVDDDGYLLASFDGVTLLEDITWECKQWNQEKAEGIRRAGAIPEADYWQVIHQMAVSGAESALYTLSDGTESGTLHACIEYDQEAVDKLMAGWRQFDEDLANWQPKEAPQEATGSAPGGRWPAGSASSSCSISSGTSCRSARRRCSSSYSRNSGGIPTTTSTSSNDRHPRRLGRRPAGTGLLAVRARTARVIIFN